MTNPWTAERWRRIEQVFEAAAALPQHGRADYLAGECAGDAPLRAQVERMLIADGVETGMVDGAAMRPVDIDPYLGAQCGAWRIESRIAEGGMGTVYRAVRADGAFPRPVAVKILHVGLMSATTRRRFLREPRLLGRIEHRNIARLLDGGATPDGVPYIVTELIDGVHLDRYCDTHALPVRARLRLFETICLAADHAHRGLVLHRDLKPSNILVGADGEPRLVDFGVAALLEDPERADGRDATGTQPAAYTPEYASPEQMRGETVGVASDVWSLGVVLHELLTGVRPFRSDQVRALAADSEAAVAAPVPSARFAPPDSGDAVARAAARSATPLRLSRDLRGDLDRIVAMALDPDPRRRYPSCRELAADVRRHLDGFPVTARPRSTWYRIERFVVRHRLATSLGAALALSVVGGAILSLVLARQSATERDAAVAARRTAEQQARHASIEADSSSLIATALTEVFLDSSLFDETLRDRLRERILERAAEVRRKHGADPHVLANLIDALGNASRRIGLRDEGKSLIVEALELRTRHFGTDHLERALSLGSLGTVELDLGNATAAREAFDEACRIHMAHPGDVHADVARAKNDLAAACAACGDYDRALELHRQALRMRERDDPDSLAVAESQNNLGAALLRLGRRAEAKECLDIALRIRRRILGDGAYLTLQCLANRAVIELRAGSFAAARRDVEEAIAGMRRLRGSGTEALVVLLARLASVAVAQNDLDTARQALEEGVALAADLFSADHPRTAELLAQRAGLHAKRQDYAAAIADREEVVRIRRGALPPDHPLLALSIYELGMARADAGDFEGAERDLTASTRVRPNDGARNAAAHGALGLIYSRTGRLSDAERELLRARADAASDDRELRAAIRRALAALYRATGRPAEAEALEAESGSR